MLDDVVERFFVEQQKVPLGRRIKCVEGAGVFYRKRGWNRTQNAVCHLGELLSEVKVLILALDEADEMFGLLCR